MNAKRTYLIALAAIVLEGCGDQPTATKVGVSDMLGAHVTGSETSRYVVVFALEDVPADFEGRIASLGGSVEAMLDSIGVAAVTGLTEVAATELAADGRIWAVEHDVVMTRGDDGPEATDASAEETVNEALAPADATASPTAAEFYARQWNMRAVFAPDAWAAGHLGSRDVVVAILDSGIDYLHPDLAGLVDLGRSTSFVPEDEPIIAERFPDRLPISDLRGHGTATASIVASNGQLLAGVNRAVTLIAVKI